MNCLHFGDVDWSSESEHTEDSHRLPTSCLCLNFSTYWITYFLMNFMLERYLQKLHCYLFFGVNIVFG